MKEIDYDTAYDPVNKIKAFKRKSAGGDRYFLLQDGKEKEISHGTYYRFWLKFAEVD